MISNLIREVASRRLLILLGYVLIVSMTESIYVDMFNIMSKLSLYNEYMKYVYVFEFINMTYVKLFVADVYLNRNLNSLLLRVAKLYSNFIYMYLILILFRLLFGMSSKIALIFILSKFIYVTINMLQSLFVRELPAVVYVFIQVAKIVIYFAIRDIIFQHYILSSIVVVAIFTVSVLANILSLHKELSSGRKEIKTYINYVKLYGIKTISLYVLNMLFADTHNVSSTNEIYQRYVKQLNMNAAIVRGVSKIGYYNNLLEVRKRYSYDVHYFIALIMHITYLSYYITDGQMLISILYGSLAYHIFYKSVIIRNAGVQVIFTNTILLCALLGVRKLVIRLINFPESFIFIHSVNICYAIFILAYIVYLYQKSALNSKEIKRYLMLVACTGITTHLIISYRAEIAKSLDYTKITKIYESIVVKLSEIIKG